MTFAVQQGYTGTEELVFKNTDGSVAPAPTSGGSVSISNGNLGSVSLGTDQKTVSFKCTGLGTGQITYTGPQGLSTTIPCMGVATTATSVAFDETTFTEAPTPPPG